MNRILIVEDEVPIAQLIEMSLARAGYQCEAVNDGCAAADKIEQNNYDLVLLDIMLPGLDGYELLEYLRPMGTPVIFITAKGTLGDRVRGLNLGADDYIVKPFEVAELVARVKAHLSRYARLTGASREGGHEEEILEVGPLKILPRSRKVYKNGLEIKFPNREFELLLFLAENPNVVFSRERLFEKIWGYDYVGESATVTVHINRIREKIEDVPSEPVMIETVWGAGYRLNQRA